MFEMIKYIGHLMKQSIKHLLLSTFVIALIGIPVGLHGVHTFLKDFGSEINYGVLDNFDFYGQRVKMLDENGNIIKVFLEQKDTIKFDISTANPDYVSYFVAIEDRRFYEHEGVDFEGMARALYVNVTNSALSQGASTLTQQLIRSQVLTTEKTFTRKLTEIYLALELEKQLSKSEILEMYLNTTYFGYGNYGIESASKFYYGKEFNDLTLSQLCSLIPIAQSPNNFNPVNNLELNNRKRTTVLGSLLEQQLIDETTYNDALSDESYADVRMSRDEYNTKVTSIDSYYVESAYEQVIGDLMLYKDLSRQEAIDFLKDRGCLIYTYYDEEIENILNDLGESRFEALDDEIQTAIAIINNDGEVKGILGGYDKKPTNYSLNRAMQSTRSPGSTFKPIVAYTPALEYLNYTSTSTVKDVKRSYQTISGLYEPNNYNNRYLGDIPLYQAVAKSINSVAVDLLNSVGTTVGFNQAQKLGITTLVDNRNGFTDKGLSTALGGLTDGVKIIDMATAYNSIKTTYYQRPCFYRKVVDSDGNLILFTPELPRYQKEKVIKDTTSAYMMDALREVVLSGTGTILKDAKVPVLGKTGTTNDDKDLWFVGSTPSYTISLWYGYDTPKPIATGNKHVKLYKELVNRLVDSEKESTDNHFVVTVDSDIYDTLKNKDLFVREESKPEEEIELIEEEKAEIIKPDAEVIEEEKEEVIEEIVEEVKPKPSETPVLPEETPVDDLREETGLFDEPAPTLETEPTEPTNKPILTPEQEEVPEQIEPTPTFESTDIFGDALEEVSPSEDLLPSV